VCVCGFFFFGWRMSVQVRWIVLDPSVVQRRNSLERSRYDHDGNVFMMDKKDKRRKNQAGKSLGGTYRGRSGFLM
jgi:hypothetical protein